MPAQLEIIFGGERLVLLPDRALHWIERQTLVLADVHLGKDASFRAAGLPVPAGNSAKDLLRIELLICQIRAKRLVILGDLVHNKASHQEELFAAFCGWRSTHRELEILLVRGNHDKRAGPVPMEWCIEEVAEPFDAGELQLAHYPDLSDQPVLCGHVHPTVAVRDYDRSTVSLPCFVVDPRQLILPAFGSFTGGHKIYAEPGRKIYAVAGKSVVAV